MSKGLSHKVLFSKKYHLAASPWACSAFAGCFGDAFVLVGWLIFTQKQNTTASVFQDEMEHNNVHLLLLRQERLAPRSGHSWEGDASCIPAPNNNSRLCCLFGNYWKTSEKEIFSDLPLRRISASVCSEQELKSMFPAPGNPWLIKARKHKPEIIGATISWIYHCQVILCFLV